MSDRIALFNSGRIEQVGNAAEIYERPASPFVAGFVGTSNLLTGEAARALIGRDGTFSIRPEKIQLSSSLEPVEDPAFTSATGTVADVVYAGPSTRFVVDLDAGARLVALQQNLHTSSIDVLDYRNARIRLSWRTQHCIAITAAPESGSQPESLGGTHERR
jgi:putative spermidine/putrescine transport system ATP-binding protein